MGRKPNSHAAVRAARADWELRSLFPDLHDAALAWRDTGDVDRLELAFETLDNDTQRFSPSSLSPTGTREERITALAKRYVVLTRAAGQARKLTAELDAEQAVMRAELTATLALGSEIAVYQRQFVKRLEAAGIGQPDLHPASRALAQAVATTIRQYNGDRRAFDNVAKPEDYEDQFPLSSWSELPRTFAGYELVDVDPEDMKFRDVYPLPPATDIAEFTPNGSRPEPLGTNRETIIAWLGLIEAWSEGHAIELKGMHSACWAMLLAHRMVDDNSRIKNLDGVYVASPWEAGRVVRIVMLPPPNSSEVEA
jgi:hypothetical protein